MRLDLALPVIVGKTAYGNWISFLMIVAFCTFSCAIDASPVQKETSIEGEVSLNMLIDSRSWVRIPVGYFLDTVPYMESFGQYVISGTDQGSLIVLTKVPGMPEMECEDRCLYQGAGGFKYSLRSGFGIGAVRDCSFHNVKKGYVIVDSATFAQIRSYSLCDAVYAIDVPVPNIVAGSSISVLKKG